MNHLPATKAHLRIFRQSFTEKCIHGEVSAGEFEWEFKWFFGREGLIIQPSLGRALIQDALMRFLVKTDYKLEAGGHYIFSVRAKF